MEHLEDLQEQIVREDLLKSRIMYGNALDSAKVPPGAEEEGGSVEVIERGKEGNWERMY